MLRNSKLILINSTILRYVFSGIIISLSNFIVLYLLVQKLHFWYLISSVISFSFGIIIGYYLHKFITFKNYSTDNIVVQFFGFLVFNLVMLTLNTFLMYIFVDIFGLWYLFSQIFITIFLATINYIFFSRILFSK